MVETTTGQGDLARLSEAMDFAEASTPDAPSAVATEVMALPWASGGNADEHCDRYGDVQLAAQRALARPHPAPAEDGGEAPILADLHARCAEIVDWRRTGTLKGEVLRAFAETDPRCKDYHDAIGLAENVTLLEAAKVLAAAPALAPETADDAGLKRSGGRRWHTARRLYGDALDDRLSLSSDSRQGKA